MTTHPSTLAPTTPLRVLVLHASADRHHMLAFQRAFEAQPRASGCRLIPFGVPNGTMCGSTITHHLLAKADVVVYLLSPRYVALNPDWAGQLRRAKDARANSLAAYVVVAEPLDLNDIDSSLLASPCPGRLPMRELAAELLDLLEPASVHEVLCMFANSVHGDPLALGREWRDIDDVNRRARRPLSLTPCWAARVRDLQDAMLHRRIDVLHFSGHGEPGGVCFETNDGGRQWVEIDRLVRVLAYYRPRCLVINACHSADSIDSLRSEIPYLIGMQGPTPDDASIEFSRAFYAALAHRWTIPQAFEHACHSASLHDERCRPLLLTRA